MGMKISRYFTTANTSPYDSVEWATRDITMVGAGAKVIFQQLATEVPAWWSDRQAQVCVSK